MFKRIIIYALISLFFGVSFAQKEIEKGEKPKKYIAQKGDYLKDSRLNNFEGEYSNERFNLKLKKVKIKDERMPISLDLLVGSYFIIKDGVKIVESNELPHETIINLNKKKTLQVGGLLNKEGELILTIRDSLKNKDVRGVLKINNDGTYILSISDIKKLYRDKKAKEGFTLPETMILTKQD